LPAVTIPRDAAQSLNRAIKAVQLTVTLLFSASYRSHTLDSAADKAYTSASFKTDTGLLVERAKTVPIAPLLAKLPNLLLFGGGVVIKFHDEVIGAIGAAGAPGGDLDENCAKAGLEKIRSRLE
jgi:uncharacterized protein GlcG (DUF336 family)